MIVYKLSLGVRRATTRPRTHTVLRWPVLLCSLPFLVLSFLLPIYAQRLGADALDIGGLAATVAVVMVLVRPFVGWALDHYGRRGFFVGGLLCYTAAMVVFALASDVRTLYLARLLQGLGAAFTWIAAYTIAVELATVTERGEALGQVDGASDRGGFYGAMTALVLLSWLPFQMGWKVLFLVYAVFAGVGAWLAWRVVPETPYRRPSAIQVAPGTAHPWLKSLVSAFIPKAFVASVSRSLFYLLAVVFITKASAAMVSPLLLVFLQHKFTTNMWLLALTYLPASFVLGFLPARLGRLSDNLGRVPLVALGLSVSGIASLLVPKLPDLGWLTVCFTCNAIGIVTAAPAQKALVGDLTARQGWGTAYGLYAFAGSLGTAIGPLLGGWLYESLGRPVPFYANGIVLLASAGWMLLMLRRRLLRAPLPRYVRPQPRDQGCAAQQAETPPL